jgi:hypothetical protein
VSRTKKGKKSPGQEYWTRRPFNRCGQIPGPFAKHRTHKAERQQAKQQTKDSP